MKFIVQEAWVGVNECIFSFFSKGQFLGVLPGFSVLAVVFFCVFRFLALCPRSQ